MEKEIKGIDCKFVVHRPATYDPIKDQWTPDIHWIKESITYTDGTVEPNFKMVKDFKRPYWLTLPHKRNHREKKLTEEIDNTKRFMVTESELWGDIAKRLGKHGVHANQRFLRSSPYIYGADINSRVFIKKAYMDKYPDAFTTYTVSTLDIENDIDTGEINIISISKEWEVYTVILRSYLKNVKDPINKLNKIFKDNIPLDHDVKVTYEIYDTELQMFDRIMAKAHEWGTDFLAIWNMDHELTYFSRLCEKNDVKMEDYFSDPSVPKEYRFFKYKKKSEVKVSASGVSKNSDVKDRWNVVYCPAKFYVIDAMCAYNYVRVNTKKVPTGYGLDSILGHELGDKFKKLKFNYLNDGNLVGADWHRHMVKNFPLEYVVYNQWDVLSMLVLENKTKDLKVSMPTLASISPFDVFDSGPKRVANALMAKCLSNKLVLGVHGEIINRDPELENHLGLDGWVVTLPSVLIGEDFGAKIIEEDPNQTTSVFTHVYDAD